MRAALDWITYPNIKFRTSESDMVEWIEKIQADALQHAARIANKYRDYDQSRDSLPIVNEILQSIPDSRINKKYG